MAYWNRNSSNNPSNPIETKEVPSGVAFSDTEPRGAISKAYFPGFMYKPPFGWPKFKDIFTIRRVAAAPQAAMAIQTIIDETIAVPWSIKPKDEDTEENTITQAHILEIEQFFDNPNTNKESFAYIMKVVLRDLLELDSGIIVKEFNEQEQMVEFRSADAAGFLKNPDIYGKIQDREDFIIEEFVDIDLGLFVDQGKLGINPITFPNALSIRNASERAAYFQFGYSATARPVPFGKREIVWLEKSPVSHDQYGRSAVENLVDTLQSLIYSITYNLEYFEDNNVPKGFINLPGANTQGLKDFQDRWNDIQLVRDNKSGRIRKSFHRVPITNSPNASFQNVQFSAQELQLIDSQKWFSSLVWSMFGVTPSELGFTEDSNRATEIAQSRVFKRRAVLPLLTILEYYINKEIISEWEYDDVEFKFNTFDVEEEIVKYGLYQTQVNTKIRTINEIRKDEGLDEVAWGDGPASMQSELGIDPEQEFSSNGNEGDKPKTKKDEIRQDANKKALSAQGTIGNVTLGENELIAALNKKLDRVEKIIIEMIRQEVKRDRLSQIKTKSLDDISKRIEEHFDFRDMENEIMKSVEEMFNQGWNESEDKLEEDAVQPEVHIRARANQEQIKFIQAMTFGNIIGASNDFKNKLRQELQRAMINGDGVGVIVKNVRKVFDITRNRAKTIVRTELIGAFNQGTLQAMKSSGVVKTKTWLAILDDRTCPICERLHLKTVGINEQFKDRAGAWEAPTSHPNCRCRLLFDLDKKDFPELFKNASKNNLG